MTRHAAARRVAWLGAVALAAAFACAHAPPATGNHAPDAAIDPDYPEQNCAVNNTIDCMPASPGP